MDFRSIHNYFYCAQIINYSVYIVSQLATYLYGPCSVSDKKKSSFANTLKKRFSRPKKRSQSADRAYSSSFKESSLLKPPEHADSGPQARTAGIL